jgi:hypothetical protein
MVLCIDYSVLTLNYPRNILFQIILINSEGLFGANILDDFVLFGKKRSHLKSLRILLRVATE